MEAFSLLKYWKAGGGGGGGGGRSLVGDSRATAIVTTAVSPTTTTTTAESDSDGPFFDLEFTLPSDDDDDDEEEEEIKAEPEEDNDVTDSDDEEEEEDEEVVMGSPSEPENLFFKGRLVVPVDPEPSSEPNSKPPADTPTQFSLLKSATKFRVFLLGFKKTGAKEDQEKQQSQPNPKQKSATRKMLTVVKLKVEEVPIASLFTRDTSKSTTTTQSQQNVGVSEENKRFGKYINKVKPLYVKVSKMKFVKGGEGGKVGGFGVAERRRDDSLLEQQDGIQGAILHCKRSFNASRDSEVSVLPRSVSDPSHEKSTELLCRNALHSAAICARKAASSSH